MVFVLEQTDENKIIAQMIKHGGGCVATSTGPYGICLSPPNSLELYQDEAVFSTEFIRDCCLANRILDINQYSLGGPASYPDNFNVMKVLLRQSHWPTVAERDENDPAQTDRNSDSDYTTESQNSIRGIVLCHNRTFSGNDEKEILQYIVENKEIGLVLGNTLWKKIAQKKVPGRTWQSLKKHFLKHMLPNITKYTFLSVTDRLEFQKHLPKPAESDVGGSSSMVVSERHLEEHRSDREPSPCASSVSNDGSSLERNCDRRIPEKRKPFRMPRVLESSDNDTDSHSHPKNADDQRLQDIRQFYRSTSSQEHHENKDNQHHKKQDDPQSQEKSKTHIIQRQQSHIRSSDEVDSGNEEHNSAPVVQRRNEESRKSSNHSSSDGDWFLATDQGNSDTTLHTQKKTRKRRREEFTMEEEYAILTYLQKHNRFSNTRGNNVWKNMATTESVGKRHTWQSLRERYLKKIVPNINKYNLPEEIKRRVKFK